MSLHELVIPPLSGELGATLCEEVRQAYQQLAQFKQRIKVALGAPTADEQAANTSRH